IVRLPLNKVGLTNRISKAFSQLEQEFEREPTPEELAVLLGIEVEEVAATLGLSARHVSMDQPLADGEDSTMMDVFVNKDELGTDNELAVNASLNTEIERSLSTLTERQKEVIRFFFGIGIDHPLSLEDIGERFSLTRERVRQIKDKAITKLRTASRCKLLRSYLGA
ncbi:MAG: RNA polymerase subunit sigma, partial [Chitinophagaceae bacterium]